MTLEVLPDEQGTYFYLRASTNMFLTYQVFTQNKKLPRMQGPVPTCVPNLRDRCNPRKLHGRCGVGTLI